MSRTAHAPAMGTLRPYGRIVAASVTAALLIGSAAACAPAEEEPAAPVSEPAGETSNPVSTEETQVKASSRDAKIPRVWSDDAEKFDAPSSADLKEIDELLSDSVDDAAAQGVTLTWCLRSLDTKKPVDECVGDDETTFAASIPKLAAAVAAIEAYEGNLDEVVIDEYTPWSAGNAGLRASYDESMGEEADDAVTSAAEAAQEDDEPTTLGDLVAASIAYSDNDAVNELIDVIPDGPAFGDVEADSSSASAAEYLSALIAAADAEVTDENLNEVAPDALTTPKTARAVLSAMAQQFRSTKIPGELPTGTFANKTGETDSESHDLAVVGTKSGRFVLSAVSSFYAGTNPPDEQLAETAKEVVGVLGGSERL